MNAILVLEFRQEKQSRDKEIKKNGRDEMDADVDEVITQDL